LRLRRRGKAPRKDIQLLIETKTYLRSLPSAQNIFAKAPRFSPFFKGRGVLEMVFIPPLKRNKKFLGEGVFSFVSFSLDKQRK